MSTLTNGSDPKSLEIRVLGVFEVAVDGARIEASQWHRRKAKLLVKLLAVQPRHRMHREQVMDCLWPESDTEVAANHLYKAVYAARRALEPTLPARSESHFILLQDQNLVLRAPETLWIDAEEFDYKAGNAIRTGDTDSYEAALSSYSGDLLAEDPYEEWAVARRDRLRQLHRDLLLRLALIYENEKHYEKAIPHLQRIVEGDPSDEDVQRRLIRLYALSGSRHQALAQFRHCCEALKKELGAEPDSITREVYEQAASGALSYSGMPPPELAPVRRYEATPESFNEATNGVSRSIELFLWPTIASVLALVLLALALRSLSLSLGGGRLDSLAILPLVNQSADARLEYLCDGVAETLIDNVSRIPGIRVMPMSSVLRYKGRQADLPQIGRELRVGAIMIGSVRQLGERLVISMQLISLTDGSQVWGQHYNSRLPDVLAIQEGISRQIVERLQVRLTPEQQNRISRRYTEDSEAYQDYLKGRYHWNKRTSEELRKGIQLFKLAIERDPG